MFNLGCVSWLGFVFLWSPFALDVTLPKGRDCLFYDTFNKKRYPGLILVFPVLPPEDQKAIIAIESLIMRLVGLPQSLAKLEVAKFEDSVQYWCDYIQLW